MYCKRCNTEFMYQDATVKQTNDGWDILEVTTEQGYCPKCDNWMESVSEPIDHKLPAFDVLYKHTQLRTVVVRAKDEEEARLMVEQMDETDVYDGTYLETEEPMVLEVTAVK